MVKSKKINKIKKTRRFLHGFSNKDRSYKKGSLRVKKCADLRKGGNFLLKTFGFGEDANKEINKYSNSLKFAEKQNIETAINADELNLNDKPIEFIIDDGRSLILGLYDIIYALGSDKEFSCMGENVCAQAKKHAYLDAFGIISRFLKNKLNQFELNIDSFKTPSISITEIYRQKEINKEINKKNLLSPFEIFKMFYIKFRRRYPDNLLGQQIYHWFNSNHSIDEIKNILSGITENPQPNQGGSTRRIKKYRKSSKKILSNL